MRNPVWMLNLGLAALFLVTLGILVFTKKRVPPRSSLVAQPVSITPKQPLSAIDVSRIYENDLFGTYMKPPTAPIAPPETIPTIPQAPTLQLAPKLQQPRVQFLEPLAITLKGIISSSDERDNRAVIADNKTQKEDLYAVGDTIEDAEIIRIARNKVIFIRSNGQQETLFLTVDAANADPIFAPISSWSSVVKRITDRTFVVDPEELQASIGNLAQFIDNLDVTTAYEKGVPVGCRIGVMKENSIGFALGLQNGDIIESINDTKTATTKDRVSIYHAIRDAQLGSSVSATIIRGRQNISHTYVVELIEEDMYDDQEIQNEKKVPPMFMPPPPQSLKELQGVDKAAMKQFGGRAALLQ